MLDQTESTDSCPELGRVDTCRQYLDFLPEDAGPRVATLLGGAAHSIRLAGSQTLMAEAHLVEIVLAPVAGMEYRRGHDSWQATDAPAGTVLASPANVDTYARWSSLKESAVIALKPSSLKDLAAHEPDFGNADLRWPSPGTMDPFALGIAQMLKAELTRNERGNARYIDALVTQFGVHLLRSNIDEKPVGEAKSRLSNYNARKVRAFMTENLARKLTLADLAAVCGLSASHFANAFTATFGQAPHRYLINLRLAYAEKLLAERDISIAEVAYLSGFSSQSHLTSAMRKLRGATPFKIRAGK